MNYLPVRNPQKLDISCEVSASGDLLFADNLCKQFGPRSGLTEYPVGSRSKLLVTLIVFLRKYFEEVNFEKKSVDDDKKYERLSMQRVLNQCRL